MSSPEIEAMAKARARSSSDASSVTQPTALEAALSESIDVGGSLGSEDEAVEIIGKYRSILYTATGTWVGSVGRPPFLCSSSFSFSPTLFLPAAPLRLLTRQSYAFKCRAILS